MHPVLFDYGPLIIRSYGFFIALGVVAAMVVAIRLCKLEGIDHNRVLDMAVWAVLAGLVTSRLGYAFTEPGAFRNDPLEIFRLWNGGLVFYWGLLGGAGTALFFIRRYRLPLWKTADLAAVCVPLAHTFGRIGCFMAGCCYGRECALPWAVTFTNPDSLAPQNVPLHPTQLYESGTNLIIFGLLYLLHRRRRFEGQIFATYLVLYAAARFTIEFFRGDERGSYLLDMFSPAQATGLVMGAAGIALWTFHYLRHRRARRA
jgi:phosphatidylglycerol:prolipoprotein diacylglycerol transferase